MPTHELFSAFYRITATAKSEAETIADNICIEQSVEMPLDVVPEKSRSSIAKLRSINADSDKSWIAEIGFPSSLIDNDRTQFLNVLFGNSSLQHSIQLIDVDDTYLNELLPGPSFGITGIRNLLDVYNRPLSCTALKPVGLSPADFAERAYHFSRGGIDIIKDDHGLTNQKSADFYSRVASCVRAVRKGEQISGKRTLYFPNITTSPLRIVEQYETVIELGADGVLISPQLAGLETMSFFAERAEAPIMAHPSFSGSMVIHPSQGISPELYYGKIWRSFGADAVIYPNANGRFSFDLDLCKRINKYCRMEMGSIKPALPTPGGGINRDSIQDWMKDYGCDTLFLVGGSLYQHPEGIETATKEFQETLMSYGK